MKCKFKYSCSLIFVLSVYIFENSVFGQDYFIEQKIISSSYKCIPQQYERAKVYFVFIDSINSEVKYCKFNIVYIRNRSEFSNWIFPYCFGYFRVGENLALLGGRKSSRNNVLDFPEINQIIINEVNERLFDDSDPLSMLIDELQDSWKFSFQIKGDTIYSNLIDTKTLRYK